MEKGDEIIFAGKAEKDGKRIEKIDKSKKATAKKDSGNSQNTGEKR